MLMDMLINIYYYMQCSMAQLSSTVTIHRPLGREEEGKHHGKVIVRRLVVLAFKLLVVDTLNLVQEKVSSEIKKDLESEDEETRRYGAWREKQLKAWLKHEGPLGFGERTGN
jgi:hypothetical protein